MTSSELFRKLIVDASYQGKYDQNMVPLTNITFFLGAGFSKSWDSKFPTGWELFSLKYDDCMEVFQEYLSNIKYDNVETIDFEMFKDILYQLSMMKKYPSLQTRYLDDDNIEMIENSIRATILSQFEKLAPINYLEQNGKLKLENLTGDQKQIIDFFSWLNDQITGDRSGMPEGLRVNFMTTNYDFLIESIQDQLLPSDDTFALYNYRGFTPKKVNRKRNIKKVFDHLLVNSLIKINGGFEIFDNGDSFEIDYHKKSPLELEDNAPILILPNREQDYTGKYFQTIFPKAIKTLQESEILVIVGYSLPEEDSLLKLLLRQFAEQNTDGTKKIIFYIDKMTKEQQRDKIIDLFPYLENGGLKFNLHSYSGSFNEWVRELMNGVGEQSYT